MKLTFRWYGEDDPISLQYIRQIPCMSGIVSAVYDVLPGKIWSNDSINRIKSMANSSGLDFEVVESVPVPEEIKLGGPDANALIDNYCENIRRLGKAGVKVVCYNFMPVFDWLRSELDRVLPDGSKALAFDNDTVLQMDPSTGSLHLPGWDESYTSDRLKELLDRYRSVDEEKLWENFAAFLNKVIPVCVESGVSLAIHPDDPPWGIFGLPRIITGAESYRRMKQIRPEPENGITLCTGSLGANPANNISEIVREFSDRIHFVHLRNISVYDEKCFCEAPHPTVCGSLDMYEIVFALVETGFDGYVRPDHGRMIWGESGKPGYGLYDRALGAAYIVGLFEAVEKSIGGQK